MECQYQLMRFGIPQCILPVDSHGKLDKTEFLTSIEHMRLVEESHQPKAMIISKKTPRIPTSHVVYESAITSQDVLLGKGVSQLHTGNLKLSEIIHMKRSSYQAASKFEKTCIAMVIVDMTKKSGGRFLKRRHKGSPEWVEARDSEAHRSIVHRFRNKSPLLWTSAKSDEHETFFPVGI